MHLFIPFVPFHRTVWKVKVYICPSGRIRDDFFNRLDKACKWVVISPNKPDQAGKRELIFATGRAGLGWQKRNKISNVPDLKKSLKNMFVTC